MSSINNSLYKGNFTVKKAGITNIGKLYAIIDGKSNRFEVTQVESYSDIQETFYTTFAKSKWLKSDWSNAKIIW